ncbi:1,4-alpha-glucan branching enzyme GlgB [Sulfuriferula plumbiphila]|uniref:1,4-alpha-glucan branching enzyme GlgB n=1 Tax=Sulfuriferula plumbiphila TaxID=171865 RepID=A0A512L7F4_9PROT|nr:1,4-alpha-glucan branching protein GlgB [Sulfuriferula plumbiphila]BBP04063.1 1,4-alpha-glucan branching enzyme GlgB [Sulfuriferula plumbiphila]GEP30420.1 1,4-alpha-glucan branching enzyme GlgB [Sulfuriferula plumbiphila]
MTAKSSAPKPAANTLPEFDALAGGRAHNPCELLGLHQLDAGWLIRIYDPYAVSMTLLANGAETALQRVDARGVFEWRGAVPPVHPYRIRRTYPSAEVVGHDPYAFSPQLTEHDLYLFNEGRLHQAYQMLGSQPYRVDGVDGVRFALWAPNADRVSVVGDFNHWDGRRHPMCAHGDSGVWELFIPDIMAGAHYKYEIHNRHSGQLLLKSDPYAQFSELRPGTASRVAPVSSHTWNDAAWLATRANRNWLHAPMNVYEIHAGSWRRHPDGRFYTYRELAGHLVPYVLEMGYTHIELMPVNEHPLDESWGYQATGYFAPTSRFGSADDLRHFIDTCHQAGLGVLLDWVPAHFPQDGFALARFDGTALYEHEDPRMGFHQDWGTYIFNYGRNEVKSFLLSSAHYWLAEFHFDGLRVDAVASMLYLDYSREAGEWLPNRFGGRENLDAIEFLRELNILVHDAFPGALTLAEESTSWPMVSRPVYLGGLGFSMKWNMGWMNDTLTYIRHDPVHRKYHHDLLTFGQLYAYTENFMLPFSHDEVVHGKGSLIGKMPGDTWQQFANLRLLFAYQMTTPGKKLNFMGNEFAQGREWNPGWELDWSLLQNRWHEGVHKLVHDLNQLYRGIPALHQLDFSADGFAWIDCHDAEQSILSYVRYACDGSHVVVVLNFTPVLRTNYRIGLPQTGSYSEIFNSDSTYYGGSNAGNGAGVLTDAAPWMGYPASLTLTVPPLAGIILVPNGQ